MFMELQTCKTFLTRTVRRDDIFQGLWNYVPLCCWTEVQCVPISGRFGNGCRQTEDPSEHVRHEKEIEFGESTETRTTQNTNQVL